MIQVQVFARAHGQLVVDTYIILQIPHSSLCRQLAALFKYILFLSADLSLQYTIYIVPSSEPVTKFYCTEFQLIRCLFIFNWLEIAVRRWWFEFISILWFTHLVWWRRRYCVWWVLGANDFIHAKHKFWITHAADTRLCADCGLFIVHAVPCGVIGTFQPHFLIKNSYSLNS